MISSIIYNFKIAYFYSSSNCKNLFLADKLMLDLSKLLQSLIKNVLFLIENKENCVSFKRYGTANQIIMNLNQNSKPQGVMDSVVEEELCRQAFSLFDKSGSGTISKTVCTPNLYYFLSSIVFLFNSIFYSFSFTKKYNNWLSSQRIIDNIRICNILITLNALYMRVKLIIN